MFENKLVAVLNKSLDSGIAMNALAHMTIGLGAQLDNESLSLDTYIDAQENHYPNISQMPFMILRASGGKIRTTAFTAREKSILHGVFLNTMTGGTYVEQIERTKSSKEEDLNYYGIVLYGKWDTVSEMTKKFSLWK
ncbi:MAG: DUF2000 domain-containing protein [Alphaproteobacteria bacterium]|jgi:hypothetical protein|nr:DUF2000 domain-containing protein [Alphaproteobacteria bacterium]MBT5389824.1 DUF2000 domain-containing protein [Alphaproteobacteria bacterium]MBT5654379.1 DUF2000 domain-containing protein [Alphaproteobacteria bacterium]